MGRLENFLNWYSRLLARRPVTFLAAVILVTAVLAAGGSNVQTVEQNTEDFLPESVPSIAAFNTLQAEFGTAEAASYTVLIETAPENPGSNEIRDVRDPRAIRYVTAVSNDLNRLEKVTTVSSAADIFSDVPSSKRQTQQVMDQLGKPRWSQHISEDYTAMKIEVQAAGLSAEEQRELSDTVRRTVEAHQKPPGLTVSYTGQTYIDEAFQEQSQRTTSITTAVALIGVLLVVILLFRSVYYGLTTLSALIFGIAAGFGVFGYLGYSLSPATSGAISIGIGIAIDFGIQPVARYREERSDKDIKEALNETLQGVVRPMTLGVIGAIMGFTALSTGRITFLSSLGILLSLTTFLAYIAAFTVIPPTVIIYDRYIEKHVENIIGNFRK